MFNSLSMATNAAMSSLELIDFLSGNIINGDTPGFNAKRFTFRDYLHGGTIEDTGNSWRQGRMSVRVGEPTKMMIRGKGMFSLLNHTTGEVVYTRLGDFNIDKNGYLGSHDGFLVLGTPLESNIQPGTSLAVNQVGPKYKMDAYKDPFNNPANKNFDQVAHGAPTGQPQPINLYLDPTNGLYLGKYDKIRVDKDGIIWGKYGDSEVSLYKVSLRTFQNYNGLKNFRDIYWKATKESGIPLPATGAMVFNNALERSNVHTKVEVDYMIEAQRQYAAALNTHKVADRLVQQAIELVG
jgi:flagellar hook protein FlgE